MQETIYGEWTLRAPPVRGAITTIKNLIQAKHPIRVITRRTPNHCPFAEQWLRRHSLAEIPFSVVNSAEQKGSECKKYRIDVYLDNDPEVLKFLIPLVVHPVLFDPYQIASEESWNGPTVGNWKGFRLLIGRVFRAPSKSPSSTFFGRRLRVGS